MAQKEPRELKEPRENEGERLRAAAAELDRGRAAGFTSDDVEPPSRRGAAAEPNGRDGKEREARERDGKEREPKERDGKERDGAKERDTSGVKERDANGVKERETSAAKEREPNGAKDRDTSGAKERDAGGVKEREPNGAKERDANGVKERDANGVKERELLIPRDRESNPGRESNGAKERTDRNGSDRNGSDRNGSDRTDRNGFVRPYILGAPGSLPGLPAPPPDDLDGHALAPLEALSLRDDPIPSLPPPAIAGPWRSYKEILAGLAQRVIDAQRPIRILQALRWEGSVEEQFLRAKQRELPRVTYSDDLGFDPDAKIREFDEILRDAERELGKSDRLGKILRATADEYRQVVRMLMGRGTREFYNYSRRLYGSPKDKLPDGRTSVRDMGFVLYDLLTAIGGERLGPMQRRDITAEMAALELNVRFDRYFGDSAIRVQVDDTLLADAAAGSDYVKIRSGATFSKSDIDILEAHEGWVHVGTSLNGQAQPVARWLAKGPPRTTAVQEGLAALVEIFTFRSTPRRAKKLNDRILAVDKAEDGASFLDLFEWYRTEGYDEEECFQNARRVFRGGLLEGGAPFTKDACYCKGIVLNYAFMRAAIQQDKSHLIPFLFVGKVAHEDVPVLYAHVTDGVVKPPPFLPPIFDDMNGLAVWLCYSSFFSRLGGTAIAEYYGKILST